MMPDPTGQIPCSHWAYSTGRAFVEADAAWEEAKRIIAAARTGTHQPYRDPDDQTGYHGAIA